VCGAGDSSAWSTLCGFSTTAVPTLVNSANPYTQGFEGTNDFYFVNGACTNAWAIGSATSNSGTNALYVSNDGGTSNAYSMDANSVSFATKLFQLGAGTYHYSFDWKGYGESSYDYMRVALVPASVTLTAGTSLPSGLGTTTVPTGWIALDGGSKLNQSSSFQTRSGDVVVADSGLYNLVFVWCNDGSAGSNPPAAVDNISFTMPSCSTPGAAVATNITATSADLSWAAGSATQSNFIVAYGTGTNPDLMTTVNAATTSTTLTGLTPNTAYNVFVKAVCSATEQSEWSVMASFHTPCVVADSAIFFEGAEGTTGTSLPDCWTTGHIYKVYSGTADPFYTGTSTKIGMRGFVLRDMQSGNISYLCSQAIDFEQLGKYSFRYQYYRPSGTSSLGEGLKVFVTPTPGDTANAVAVIPFVNRYAGNSPVGTTGWNTYEGVINYQDTGYIMVVGYSKYGSSSYFDNLEVYLSPSCLHVGQVALSNIAATSVDVAWQLDDTTQNNFVVAYGTGTDPDNMTTVNAATTYTTLTGLTPATTYNVFVKAVCSATDQSEWSSMITFATPAVPATVPYICGFEDAADNSSWLTVAGSGVNHFVIGTDTNAVRSGANALYVADATGSYGYNTSSSTKTFAYRPIQLAVGTYAIDFDWTCTGGESTWDFGSVMILSADQPLVGGAGSSYTSTTWPNYLKRCEPAGKQFFNLTSGQNSYSGTFTVTNPGIYNIAVMWSNDASGGTANYPLAVDNISIQQIHTLTVAANDTTMGTVTGSGVYAAGDTATLTATANTGYRFVSWNDGDTNAIRTIIVTADSAFTATFAINQHTLTVSANHTAMGIVTGAGVYNDGDTATLTATANTGYHFVNWNDGDTNAIRTVIVTADATYIANFAINQYTLTVAANDPTMGTVTGSGTYNYNSTATLTASANTGYHFVSWNDGDTNAARLVVVIADDSYTATFAANQYTLTVASIDSAMGTVTGTGTYFFGDTATLTATANYGHHFVSWNDGDTNAARLVVVNADAAYLAIFGVNTYTLTVAANDTAMGTVTGSGTYYYGDTATLTATPNSGYRFVNWTDGDTNAIRTVVVTANVTYTAIFAGNDQYAITVMANDNAMGAVTGTGLYAPGDTAVLTAAANYGYHFVNWNDGDTNATRFILVNADAAYTATFAPNQYTLTVASNDTTMGSVTGSGTYYYGDTAAIAAVAALHHHFQYWDNGLTASAANILIEQDSAITAFFAPDTFAVSSVADSTMGTVALSGDYRQPYMAELTLTATPNPCFIFVGWSDDSSVVDNPRTITVTQDTSINPIFAPTSYGSTFDEDVCDSYEWNDSIYTESGVYTQVLTSAEGCDSTVVLTLNVRHSSSSAFDTVGFISFSWNGEVYTATGTYTQHLTNAENCDSTVVMNLVVYNFPQPVIKAVGTRGLAVDHNATANYPYLGYRWVRNGEVVFEGQDQYNNGSLLHGTYHVEVPADSTKAVWVRSAQLTFNNGVGIDEAPAATMAVMPNPVANGQTVTVVIEGAEAEHASLKVYDLQGRVVLQQPVTSAATTFTANLPAGMYTVLVQGDNLRLVQRVVVR